jgi:hypothetical protein
MYLVTPLAETSALNRRCKGAMRNQRGRDNKLRKLKQSASGSNLRSSVRESSKKQWPLPKPNVYDSKKRRPRGTEQQRKRRG